MSDVDESVQDRLRELGAYTLGDDPPPEAREALLRRWAESLDGADPLRIKTERDELASLDGLSAGAVDAALDARRRSEPEPDEPTDEAPDPERVRRLFDAGRDVLEAHDQLARFRDRLTDVGYAGDTIPAELVHVALNSRNLDRPIGLALFGPSAAGKSYTVDTALRFHPDDAAISFDGSSERYLAYTDHPTRHRYVVVREASALHEDGVGAAIVRGLAWGEGIRYGTVVSTSEGPQSVTIEKPGPTGLITTSTKPLHEEIATRLISVNITDSPDQTAAITERLAREAAGEETTDPDLSVWTAASEFLAAAGENRVVVPFSMKLNEHVPDDDVRMRRDFEQILTVVRALAFAHQLRRERDDSGRVVAHAWDYANARRLLSPVLQVTLSDVDDGTREAVEAVKRINQRKYGKTDPGVSYQELADELDLSRPGAHYRARTALRRRWLVNVEERKGYPARLIVGDPLPEERTVLPPPDELFGWPLPDVPETTPPKTAYGLNASEESAGVAGETGVKSAVKSGGPLSDVSLNTPGGLNGSLNGAPSRGDGENPERVKRLSAIWGGSLLHMSVAGRHGPDSGRDRHRSGPVRGW